MKKKQFLFSLFLLIFLTGVMLLFSSTTSPLYPNSYGVDSAFNRFMGLMVRRGKTLYSEIWDNKGPVLFFIQALGTLKGTHNAEVTLTFLMQIGAILFSVLMLTQAGVQASSAGKNLGSLAFPVLCGTAVLAKVMEGGNLSEEWSLPMISCSLYLLVKYAANVKEDPIHPRRYAFVHGICFALIAFIRVNNAVSICAGLLAIALYLAYRKKWRNLWENILFGLLGAAVVTVPVMLYFLSKGALGDMLYGVFLYNLKYAAQRSHKTFMGVDLMDRFLPIGASLLILLVHWLQTRRIRLLDGMMLLIIAANGVMLWNSNIFLHYYIIYVPVILLVLVIYTDVSLSEIPKLLIGLVVFVFFVIEDIPLLSGLPDAQNAPDRFAYAALIPEDEKDPAMVLYASPEAYLNSGLIPCSRFAAYHFAHFPVDPSMKEEFLEDMQTNKPKWIVYLSGYEDIITEVKDMLDNEYEKVHEEQGIAYYRLMDES